MKNVISQSLGLDFVNINVYAKVYQNIPLSSRDGALFIFFQNLALGKASTDDQNISNGLRVIDIFCELSGEKIFTNRS